MLKYIVAFFVFVSVNLIAQNDLIIFGEDLNEISSYSSYPLQNSNSHFGNVSSGSIKSLTFTIENRYDGFLSFLGLNIGIPVISGPDASEFSISAPVQQYLAYGESTTFTISLNSTSTNIKDAQVTFSPTVIGIFPIQQASFWVRGISDTPVIGVFNSSMTRINHDLPSSEVLMTDFGSQLIGESKTYSFEINNEGNEALIIHSINSNDFSSISGEFKLVSGINFPATLMPNASINFDIQYLAQDAGIDDFDLEINSNDPETSRFNIHFTGIGIIPAAADLMISQYYENGNNDVIEVTNLSNQEIPAQAYFLAVYKKNRALNRRPNSSVDIGVMQPGEVKTFPNFTIRGNELILISTSNRRSCYADRTELIGSQQYTWGQAQSFTKGGCASESPHLNYDPNDWVSIDILKVDAAITSQNIDLGTYDLGPISWDGSSWSNSSTPDQSRIVTIDADYQGSTGNIEACDLIINAEVNFDVNSNNSLVVYRDLTIDGALVIGDQESLVMYDDNASISGTITKIEKSTFRNNQHDFTYWTSPIVNGLVSNVFTGVNQNRIFHYDQSQTPESDSSHPDFWNTWVLASGNLIPGKAYAAEGISGTTGIHRVEFNGTPNNGIITLDMNYWDDADLDNDFNLIGNPYPSAIDIELFMSTNAAVIDPTIYLWTHTTPVSGESSGDFSPDDYATYNYTGGTGIGSGVGDGPIPNKNIGSSQGFFVRAIASEKVTFDNSMRLVNANDQFFKSSKKQKRINENEKDRIWLNLTTDRGGFNQLLIGFLEEATEGLDKGYDAVKFNSNNKLSFYSNVEDKKLSIQGLGVFSEDREIALGFDTKIENRTYTISIEKMEGKMKNTAIYLYDHLLQVNHDLKESGYAFEQKEEGSYQERFSLRFKNEFTLSIEDIELENTISVYNQEDVFGIKAPNKVVQIRMYDILGRLLHESKPNQNAFEIYEPTSKKGTLLLMEIVQENNVSISRKIYKR